MSHPVIISELGICLWSISFAELVALILNARQITKSLQKTDSLFSFCIKKKVFLGI